MPRTVFACLSLPVRSLSVSSGHSVSSLVYSQVHANGPRVTDREEPDGCRKHSGSASRVGTVERKSRVTDKVRPRPAAFDSLAAATRGRDERVRRNVIAHERDVRLRGNPLAFASRPLRPESTRSLSLPHSRPHGRLKINAVLLRGYIANALACTTNGSTAARRRLTDERTDWLWLGCCSGCPTDRTADRQGRGGTSNSVRRAIHHLPGYFHAPHFDDRWIETFSSARTCGESKTEAWIFGRFCELTLELQLNLRPKIELRSELESEPTIELKFAFKFDLMIMIYFVTFYIYDRYIILNRILLRPNNAKNNNIARYYFDPKPQKSYSCDINVQHTLL